MEMRDVLAVQREIRELAMLGEISQRLVDEAMVVTQDETTRLFGSVTTMTDAVLDMARLNLCTRGFREY